MFWAQKHQRPNFDGCIYIHYAAPPYSARIRSIYLLPFGKIWLGPVCWPPCATPGNEACRTQNIRRVGKTQVPFKAICGPKFLEILGQRSGPSSFPMSMPDCHTSCFIQKLFAIKSRSRQKPNKCKSFLVPIFGREDPDFSTACC